MDRHKGHELRAGSPFERRPTGGAWYTVVRALLRGVLLGTAPLTSACGPALVIGSFGDPAFVAPPPAVAAPPTLQGCWLGTYAAPTFARRGQVAVVFVTTMSPPRGTPDGRSAEEHVGGAAGWLLITAAPTGKSAARAAAVACEPEGGGGAAPRADGVVRVPLRAAIAERGEVAVRSEAYWDVDCGCTLVLTLTARQAGDTLTGTFSARAAATVVPESRGRWRVVRTTPRATASAATAP